MMMPSIFGENLFDEMMDMPFGYTFKNSIFGKHEKNLMKTDVKEQDNEYVIDMDLPGYQKDEVKAKLEDGYLTIAAARGVDKNEQDEDGKYICKERYIGECSRSFYVGEGVRQEDIKASFENGILHLIIPKKDIQQVQNNKYIAIE